ncbi:hypothetical protein NE865_13283 [Phthorimaea operculella]|nr:hypothetical protein NE865_13283 [Phthorimaea operculella]
MHGLLPVSGCKTQTPGFIGLLNYSVSHSKKKTVCKECRAAFSVNLTSFTALAIYLSSVYLLIMFMCGYGVFCVYRIIRSMQMRILLRPRRVVFSHKKEGESSEELRTVVAYQNPFTGDYCVHKSRLGQNGYVNSLPGDSPDSGVSEEYEPLRLDSMVEPPRGLHEFQNELDRMENLHHEHENAKIDKITRQHIQSPLNYNSVTKTWNWNYKEYQI